MRWAVAGAAVLVGGGILAMGSGSVPERVVGEYATRLEARMANQRHNAALCAKALDGVVVEAGEVLSFNDVVGSWSRDKGYRRAPVSFGGQLVDAWGGGVCQTSTTLYNAGLLAGWEVVERHAHHYAPSYVSPGRDAAVAYPNIDLRMRNTSGAAVRVEASVSGERLVVRLVGRVRPGEAVSVGQRVLGRVEPSEIVVGEGGRGRVRNVGKAGWSVETYRSVGGRRERVSVDWYPVMHRVVER